MSKIKIYYKTEGNIMFPDESMLTWGPCYFHSETNAKEKMEDVLKCITEWCNEEDPSLNIAPTNVIRCYGGRQIVFRIRAWKDENTIEECKGIISVGTFVFEDDEDAETTEKENIIRKACKWLRKHKDSYAVCDIRTEKMSVTNKLVSDFKKAMMEE